MASGTSGVIGSGFTSIKPRIHGTGPGAVGTGGGVEGATVVEACCPSIVLALMDAATIALTKSRRRIVVISSPLAESQSSLHIHSIWNVSFRSISNLNCTRLMRVMVSMQNCKLPTIRHLPTWTEIFQSLCSLRRYSVPVRVSERDYAPLLSPHSFKSIRQSARICILVGASSWLRSKLDTQEYL